MGYPTYLLLRLLSTFCCCIKGLFDSEGSWYRRNMERLNRLEVAKAKLQHEMSLPEFLRTYRLAKFAFKVQFNRRQRKSIRYF